MLAQCELDVHVLYSIDVLTEQIIDVTKEVREDLPCVGAVRSFVVPSGSVSVDLNSHF